MRLFPPHPIFLYVVMKEITPLLILAFCNNLYTRAMNLYTPFMILLIDFQFSNRNPSFFYLLPSLTKILLLFWQNWRNDFNKLGICYLLTPYILIIDVKSLLSLLRVSVNPSNEFQCVGRLHFHVGSKLESVRPKSLCNINIYRVYFYF